MAEQASPAPRHHADAGTDAGTRHRSGWAVGLIVFAAITMMMVGLFQFVVGLTAIFQNQIYITTRDYLFQYNVTAWGWVHLLLGALICVAGWSLMNGRTWARVVAIVSAGLSAVANFAFLPYYPLWSLIVIALDVCVIWAVATHGRDIRDAPLWGADETGRR